MVNKEAYVLTLSPISEVFISPFEFLDQNRLSNVKQLLMTYLAE